MIHSSFDNCCKGGWGVGWGDPWGYGGGGDTWGYGGGGGGTAGGMVGVGGIHKGLQNLLFL